MNRAEGDVDGLVFGNRFDVVIDCNFCSSLKDYPVLRAVIVRLQRKGCARVYNNALHLEARTEGDTFIPALGAVVAGKGLRLACALRL